MKLKETPPQALTASSGGASVIESPTYMTPPPSTPSAATISSSAASFWPPPTGCTAATISPLTLPVIHPQKRSSSSATVVWSCVERPAADRASSGISMTGRASTSPTAERSHAASSSGISHASRLSPVQRTCSIGNSARAHSARRYGVYDVEMM